jgi:hypothetical protein
MLCRARLYFRNGELYSINQFTNTRFVDVKTGRACEHAPTKMTTQVGLDVEIPEDGYAKLRFFNGAGDFTFQSGSAYEVEVTNLAPAVTGDHFKYFYNIVRPQPQQIWYLAAGERLGLPVAGAGDPLNCSTGNFGSAVWEWLMGMLGGSKS